MIHHLKCWPTPYRAVVRGEKHHEFRRDDRGFQVGDTLSLQEYAVSIYTGATCQVKVTHITRGPDFGIPEGFVVMSVESLGEWESCADLRERLHRERGIEISAAALSDILHRRNPPGVQVQLSKTKRFIGLIRVSPHFETWLATHIAKWRKRK